MGAAKICRYRIVFCSVIIGAVHLFQWWMEPEINFTTIGRRFGFFAIILSLLVGLLYLERSGKLRIPFFVEMGKNTLNIYIIHSMLLYGSFIGIGIKTYINKSISFPQAVLGAVLFILLFGVFTYYQNKVKRYLKKQKEEEPLTTEVNNPE